MLKKFLVGTLALVFLATAGVAAAYDFGTTTLKVGSKGPAVVAVQTVVGATPMDGVFGNITKAKVQAWQAANGLTPDGIFGNMSKAKANGAVSGNFPAGCTSASGFSTLTGQACVAIPSTGTAGCPAGALFNSQTGASCTAGTPVTGLTGTAGDIATLTQLSQYSSEEVGAGQKDIKVLGIEMKASKDGDIGINSMKVSFVITNASGSTRLTDYASAVTVWQGSTKVGSSLAADFNKDSTGHYSKTISLSNSVVKSDVTEKFYITVDALSSFDSADIDSEAMTIGIDNVRYVDGSGVVTTEAAAGDLPISGVTVAFVSYSTAADTELKIATSSASPKAQVSKVSTTANTDDVALLKGTLKLTGTSDVWLDELPVALTSTGGDIQALTGSLKLVLGDKTYTESVATASTSGTITFNNLDYTIKAGSTVDFTVSADMNDIEDSGVAATDFDEGDTLTASITSTNRGNMVVENSQGDSLTDATERSGSAIGEALTFRSEGVNVAMGTVTYDTTEDTSGNITTVTYTIPVSVTSFGDTLYMGQSVQLAATATASNAFAVVFQNSTAPTTSDTAATASFTLATSNATIETNGFRLDDGVTKNFTITAVLTTPTTASNSYRVALKQLQTFTDANLGLGSTLNSLTPVESYQTGYKFITS